MNEEILNIPAAILNILLLSTCVLLVVGYYHTKLKRQYYRLKAEDKILSDTVEELETLLRMSTGNAARALRLPDYGLQPGCVADMVLLDAPSASAAIVGQAEKAYVFKKGQLRAASSRSSTLYLPQHHLFRVSN